MSTVSFPGFRITLQVKSIAFHLFSWPLHWYGIIIAVGFLTAVIFCSRRADRFGITQDDIVDILLCAVPLCILGARLYYIIFYLDRFRKADGSLDFGAMIRIWDGGLAIYGAIIAAIIIAAIFCHKRGINFFSLADLGVYGLLIGQMVGRWGNFVNVECYGGPTDLPWRMGIYEMVNGVYQYTEVHPTFLYESLWNLVGLLVLAYVLEKRRKFDGQNFWSYMAWYGLGRAWIEGMRTDSLYIPSTELRVSQVLAVVFFVVSVIVLVVQLRRPHDPKDLWGNQVAARKALQEAEIQEAAEKEGEEP